MTFGQVLFIVIVIILVTVYRFCFPNQAGLLVGRNKGCNNWRWLTLVVIDWAVILPLAILGGPGRGMLDIDPPKSQTVETGFFKSLSESATDYNVTPEKAAKRKAYRENKETRDEASSATLAQLVAPVTARVAKVALHEKGYRFPSWFFWKAFFWVNLAIMIYTPIAFREEMASAMESVRRLAKSNVSSGSAIATHAKAATGGAPAKSAGGYTFWKDFFAGIFSEFSWTMLSDFIRIAGRNMVGTFK
jgi:hypothetical protein